MCIYVYVCNFCKQLVCFTVIIVVFFVTCLLLYMYVQRIMRCSKWNLSDQSFYQFFCFYFYSQTYLFSFLSSIFSSYFCLLFYPYSSPPLLISMFLPLLLPSYSYFYIYFPFFYLYYHLYFYLYPYLYVCLYSFLQPSLGLWCLVYVPSLGYGRYRASYCHI